MDAVAIISIVAGIAVILTFLYIMVFGSKSISEWWRERKRASRTSIAPSEPPVPIITEVTWEAVLAGVTRFAQLNTRKYDLIVGIAKGGLPIAVAIAHRLPEAAFSAMLKRYVDTEHAPFFVFEEDSHRRSIRTKEVNFALPLEPIAVSRTLIVDDVTTFGNSLETAEKLVLDRFPKAAVDFYVYAADLPRLAASKPGIASRTRSSREVDNKAEWLKFPWE